MLTYLGLLVQVKIVFNVAIKKGLETLTQRDDNESLQGKGYNPLYSDYQITDIVDMWEKKLKGGITLQRAGQGEKHCKGWGQRKTTL